MSSAYSAISSNRVERVFSELWRLYYNTVMGPGWPPHPPSEEQRSGLLLTLIQRSAWEGNSANFALTQFSEVATVFSSPPCGERDIADTRRRAVPPSKNPVRRSSLLPASGPF